ncbi:MAG: sensor histidine kinase [Tumebacillaceae bacterium]
MLNRILLLTLLMGATAFLGELKMTPFGEPFRFSLGTAAYFFGLIWFRTLHPLATGLYVGLFLLFFRCLLGMQQFGGTFWDHFHQHVPSTIYYLLFATVLTITGLRKRLDKPLQVGIIAMIGDLVANVGELVVRNLFGAAYELNIQTLLILLLFGLLRSFFVVGVYNMLMIRQVRLLGEQQRQQIDRLLLINSSLYEEGFYLQKSMGHIEEITRNSYDLYRRLKGQPELARQALSISEEVHELKKDSQRILAGLDKLMRQESFSERISLGDVCGLVVNANQKYAQMLGKDISFEQNADVSLTTNRIYPLVSILNNLVANAVEAIPESGRIGIEVNLAEDMMIEWHVWDDGPGIAAEDSEYVFHPGYTTKYDTQGNPSTGIGLSHCIDLACSLGGRLLLLPRMDRTQFVVRMPTSELLNKEVSS